jgi:hypothetical protein
VWGEEYVRPHFSTKINGMNPLIDNSLVMSNKIVIFGVDNLFMGTSTQHQMSPREKNFY